MVNMQCGNIASHTNGAGCNIRVSYRILSWGGGKHDGSRMIVACESTLSQA